MDGFKGVGWCGVVWCGEGKGQMNRQDAGC
jgi:hypothetical protein